MNTEKIIAKIKKVLELSRNNPSEEEAKSSSFKSSKTHGRISYFYERNRRNGRY